MGVSVKNVTVLSWMVFSCADDSLEQKVYTYVDS